MAANGISTLANKKLRQEAKLAQANADRVARNVVEPGRYADVTADISLINNANTGGLKVGRPYAT
jgi:hypothetical protein